MTHEFDGKKYEKASDHQKEWGTRLIAKLNLTGSERVLDLGCGDGSITAQIAAFFLKAKCWGLTLPKVAGGWGRTKAIP